MFVSFQFISYILYFWYLIWILIILAAAFGEQNIWSYFYLLLQRNTTNHYKSQHLIPTSRRQNIESTFLKHKQRGAKTINYLLIYI